mmetsp:Transcript_24292/g.52260  ORF Transcript_24292/g.52260 Transcript_24292/m.52260 type:complete len:206 (+) Transcript_24292:204-821(+)
MVVPVHVDLRRKGLAQAPHEERLVHPAGIQLRVVLGREPLAEVHDEHALGAEPLHRRRDDHLDPRLPHVRRHREKVFALVAQIKLLADGGAPLIHNSAVVLVGLEVGEEIGEDLQVEEVLLHAPLDPLVAHLEHDGRAVRQLRPVDLRDRGTAEDLTIHAAEVALPVRAQRLTQRRLHLPPRPRRNRVLKLFELRHVLLRGNVRS